jgi:hypothetical protein
MIIFGYEKNYDGYYFSEPAGNEEAIKFKQMN